MDPDEQDGNRFYFKNLHKEHKNVEKMGRKKNYVEVKKIEEKSSLRLWCKTSGRVVAGEHLKQEETDGFGELLANNINSASTCPFPNVPVIGSGKCMAMTKEQAKRMDMERRQEVIQSTSVVWQPASPTQKFTKRTLFYWEKPSERKHFMLANLQTTEAQPLFSDNSWKLVPRSVHSKPEKQVLSKAGVISRLGDHCG